MRIIHLFVLLSIFLFGNVFASAEKLDSIGCTLFCCIYKHKVKTTDLNGKNVNDSTIAILEVGDNVSKYEATQLGNINTFTLIDTVSAHRYDVTGIHNKSQ